MTMQTLPRRIDVEGADAYAIGAEMGRKLGDGFSKYLETYLRRRLASSSEPTAMPAAEDSKQWIESLPKEFANRFKGLAEGSATPYERVTQWGYLEAHLTQGCSSFICRSEGTTWLAHNNDTFVPELWGYVTVSSIRGRIPTMTFGLAGDVWVTAGVNRSRLSLVTDFLPSSDLPDPTKETLPSYGVTVLALETCETIRDIADLLGQIDRTEGMILVVIDGKSEESAVFECSKSRFSMVYVESDWAVRTNHALLGETVNHATSRRPLDTWSRYERLEELLAGEYRSGRQPTPGKLKRILTDDEVERRGRDFATANSLIISPARGIVEFAYGGQSASTREEWRNLVWPW